MLAQIVWHGFTIAEISCPTRYFDDASSINFSRSVTYGFGCLKTALTYRLVVGTETLCIVSGHGPINLTSDLCHHMPHPYDTMNEKRPRRFQDLFLEDRYLLLKNHLYNYRLRCRALRKRLKGRHIHRLLEVGSGISPIVTDCPAAVYSDLSWTALEQLRRQLGHGVFVVADAACLPFRSGAVSHAISSEVLEHIQWDAEAIRELSRVIEPGGRLLVTFPPPPGLFFQ